MKSCLIVLLFAYVGYGSSSSSSQEDNLTPCQVELQSLRYENGIAAEFPLMSNGMRAVIAHGRRKNLHCHCESWAQMACRIVSNSAEMDAIVRARFAPQSPGGLIPFYRALFGFVLSNEMAMYVHPEASVPVPCLIVMIPFGTPAQDGPILPPEIAAQLRRSESFPSRLVSMNLEAPEERQTKSSPDLFDYPTQYITLWVCTGGTTGVACPITHNEFKVGQVVYILKEEIEKVRRGKSVGCISSKGLMNLKARAESHGSSGFKDPLRRTADRLLTLNDFEAYVVSGNVRDTEWIANTEEAGSSSQHAATQPQKTSQEDSQTSRAPH